MVKSKSTRMVINKKMNIVICDDEKLFTNTLAQHIHNYAAHHDFNVNLQVFYTAQTLLDADLSDCDALFLDIAMPEITGLEAARLLITLI